MVAIAGGCDIAEDLGILHALVKPGNALYIFIPSVIKWTLLGLCVVWLLIASFVSRLFGTWLEGGSRILETLVSTSWKFRIILIGQLLLFALLTALDQGQDLLLTINSSRLAVIILIGVTTILALTNWLMPKLYENAKKLKFSSFFEHDLNYGTNVKFKLDMARILGALTFLIPATAILGAMQAYHISYWLDMFPPVVLLIAVLLFYAAALRYGWLDIVFKPAGVFIFWRYIVLIIVIGALEIWGCLAGSNRQPFFLGYLSAQFFLLSFAFLTTFTYRTEMPIYRKFRIGRFIIAGGVFISLIFLGANYADFNYCATCSMRFLTLPVIMAAVILYTLIFSFLLLLGRQTGVRFITLFLLVTMTVATVSITNFHKVYEIPAAKGLSPLPSLKSYARDWLLKRRPEMDSLRAANATASYPVFFVNAYGGGIKAAAWTATAIGKLDDTLRTKNGLSAGFQHYAFSYSGASGGTIGLSLLCAARIPYAAHPENDLVFFIARRYGHF